MTQLLTDDDAATKICPFMSTPRLNVSCMASACACWGWFDGEEGQEERTDHSVEIPIGESHVDPPSGHRWRQGRATTLETKRTWNLWRRTGPRRGQCEAMSPHIEVST
jgi:hypothetical protein